MIRAGITENTKILDNEVFLYVEDRDKMAVCNYSIIKLGVFCGNDTESLNEEKTRSLNATFREELRHNSRLSAGSQLHPLMNCSFDESKFGHQKLCEAFRMNLQAALDYEVASVYLLIFGVKPDRANWAVTDMAMVILQVANVDQPPTITSCLDDNGDSNPKLTESNANMQSICKITVSFDDGQHEVQ